MTLIVIEPGLQTTIQAAARRGLRHAGVPSSGPADTVSMALANRLVGQEPTAACLEITYGAARFRVGAAMQVGVAGAEAPIRVNGRAMPLHQTLDVTLDDEIEIGPVRVGARVYLSVSGQIDAENVLGSASTYLPAAFGGHGGRALRAGDTLAVDVAVRVAPVVTPPGLRLAPSSTYGLRVVAGPDLADDAAFRWAEPFVVSPRTSRMGAEIVGPFPAQASGLAPSSAVFPGALQVTPQGRGFLLLADGQTTGGYPHLLQVIRADRHLLGQLRPGDRIRFLHMPQMRAEEALRAKQDLLQSWMPHFRL